MASNTSISLSVQRSKHLHARLRGIVIYSFKHGRFPPTDQPSLLSLLMEGDECTCFVLSSSVKSSFLPLFFSQKEKVEKISFAHGFYFLSEKKVHKIDSLMFIHRLQIYINSYSCAINLYVIIRIICSKMFDVSCSFEGKHVKEKLYSDK